jgi:predicted DNA-binding transcriptional regulator YafY
LSKKEYIARYTIIINYLKRGKAKWNDILNHLEIQSEIADFNYVISQRTFQRDISEIRTLWNYDIQNNKSTGYYFIVEDEEQNNENTHLLDSFNLFNALSLTNNYSNYIKFESRTPKGTQHIYGLLHAIKSNNLVHVLYYKHYEDDAQEIRVEPLLIKQFKGQWYLLCNKIEANEIRTYALDRIIQVDIKKKKFKPSQAFDAEDYFKHCFGIITPTEGKPEAVLFTMNDWQANYITSYPLHQSQKIINQSTDKTMFEITVFITYDLVMELLSYGDEIVIHSPKSLKKQIENIHKNSLKK